jgi:hypothetical protein
LSATKLASAYPTKRLHPDPNLFADLGSKCFYL